MAKAPRHDWYFKEWARTLEIRFPHAWLQKELDYSDGKASNVLTGKKRYDRDIINAVADALKIQPYELLMHPEDAMALRRLRESARQIAAVQTDEADPAGTVTPFRQRG
jgi:hypothetical protein